MVHMEQMNNNNFRSLTADEIEKSLMKIFNDRRPPEPKIVLYADEGFLKMFDDLMKEEFKELPDSSVEYERLTPDEIIEKYGDILSDDEIERLNNLKNNNE